MNPLLCLVMLSFLVVPSGEKMPGRFYEIPKEIRDSATVVFSGVYGEKLSPHIPRGDDGLLVRYRLMGFGVKSIYQGKLGSDYVGIRDSCLPVKKYAGECLKPGVEYLVLLRPDSESSEVLRDGKGSGYYYNALGEEEIVALVELR